MTIRPAGRKNRPSKRGSTPAPKNLAKRTNYRDLTGQTFGRLVVVGPLDRRTAGGHVVWYCVCRCGGTAEVASLNLRSGNTASCGCWQREVSRGVHGRESIAAPSESSRSA
jgi:hypothetical protein